MKLKSGLFASTVVATFALVGCSSTPPQDVAPEKPAVSTTSQGPMVGNLKTQRMPDGALKVMLPATDHFDSESAKLNPNIYPVLDDIVAHMKANKDLYLVVVGYTDGNDTIFTNKPLSFNRAKAVGKYLVGKGINKHRIKLVGRSGNDPIADNGSEAGRAQNRRVEFYVYPEHPIRPKVHKRL